MPAKKSKNRISNRWAIIAQSSALDKDSNLLSIFDIVEVLTFNMAGEIPENLAFPVKLELISLWEREEIGKPMDLKVKFVLKDPDGKTLNEGEGLIEMAKHHKRNRFRARFLGLPVTKSGIYTYEIISLEPEKTYGVELVSSTSFEVQLNKSD